MFYKVLSKKNTLIICDSIVWVILSVACFYFVISNPRKNGILKWNKNKIKIEKFKFLYGSFLVAMLVESIFAIIVGVISWQTVILGGFVLFTLVDFVSVMLILVGVLMILFVIAVWSRLRPRKDFYSPIHAMIVSLNKDVPREVVLGLKVGAWINERFVNWASVSKTFNENVSKTKFSDKDLLMWLDIEKEIKEKKGFWLHKERQEWFDDLENRFNH